MGSADRVEVHRARLLAVIGVRKTFPHGLGQKRKWPRLNGKSVLPSRADIVRLSQHVRKVPTTDSPEERKATIIMVLSHKTGTEAAQCSYCINGRLGVKVTIVHAYQIFLFPPSSKKTPATNPLPFPPPKSI